jgi:NitT/TauT family transport system substrate-binding protein
MPSDRLADRVPGGIKVLIAALLWLVGITAAHWAMNVDHDDVRVVRMGYMPVITNLACPVLDAASQGRSDVRFEALKFSSFAEMAEALRNGHIEAAFMIAPLAVVLRQQGEDVKVVAIGNRHESTLVVRDGLQVRSIRDLVGRTVAVPMRYSGHNLALRRMAREAGLAPSALRIVEMNPPDMAAALATGALDAYFVGEPFAAQTVRSGDAQVMTYVEDVWPGFICNLVVVRNDLIGRQPDAVELLVNGIVRAGLWARSHPEAVAELAARYWNQPVELVSYTLSNPQDRFVFDRYIPIEKELEEIAEEMVACGLATSADVQGLVDSSFARAAPEDNVQSLDDVLVW